MIDVLTCSPSSSTINYGQMLGEFQTGSDKVDVVLVAVGHLSQNLSLKII